VRTPVIPDLTTALRSLRRSPDWRPGKRLLYYELLTYNPLGESKGMLAHPPATESFAVPSREQMRRLATPRGIPICTRLEEIELVRAMDEFEKRNIMVFDAAPDYTYQNRLDLLRKRKKSRHSGKSVIPPIWMRTIMGLCLRGGVLFYSGMQRPREPYVLRRRALEPEPEQSAEDPSVYTISTTRYAAAGCSSSRVPSV
jgi:hypothetical protein